MGDKVDVVSSTLKEETGVWIISGGKFRGADVGSNFQDVLAPSLAITALIPRGGRPVQDNRHRPQNNIFLYEPATPSRPEGPSCLLREDGATSLSYL